MKAGMPGSAATCPSMRLKMVVSLPDVTAKQTDHGPAQVPRTASEAQPARQSVALGNPVIALDRFQNHGMNTAEYPSHRTRPRSTDAAAAYRKCGMICWVNTFM
jgi:hypothetical protein